MKTNREYAKDVLEAFGKDSMAARTMSPDELADRFDQLRGETGGRDPRLMVIHTMLWIERGLDKERYNKIAARLGALDQE